MKKIEWLWALVFYEIIMFDKRFRQMLSFFLDVPKMKNYYGSRGINNINNLRNDLLYNYKRGLSIYWAIAAIEGLTGFFLFGILNIFQKIFNNFYIDYFVKDGLHVLFFIFILGTPAFLLNYFLLFKGDKYLNYFKEFDAMNSKEKTSFIWITIFILLF